MTVPGAEQIKVGIEEKKAKIYEPRTKMHVNLFRLPLLLLLLLPCPLDMTLKLFFNLNTRPSFSFLFFHLIIVFAVAASYDQQASESFTHNADTWMGWLVEYSET